MTEEEYVRDYRRFRPPHGRRCECVVCLESWCRFIAQHYKVSWVFREVPGTDYVLAKQDWLAAQPRFIYRRRDFLRRLKAWAAHSDFSTRYRDRTGVKPVVSL